ncbi:hypothetical protein [Arthrobacter sp.]|uniref:hypothetical protein n=1 Tax=Arthrobacter sp. TaxID=1667 RepID=UPI003A900EA8
MCGRGIINIKIRDVGSFPNDCSETDASSIRNEFDVRHAKGSIDVTIEGMTGQNWSVTVAESPLH